MPSFFWTEVAQTQRVREAWKRFGGLTWDFAEGFWGRIVRWGAAGGLSLGSAFRVLYR